mgnify:CR=1 FL=1
MSSENHILGRIRHILKISGGYCEIYYYFYYKTGNEIICHTFKDRNYQYLIYNIQSINCGTEFKVYIVCRPENLSYIIRFSFINVKDCKPYVRSSIFPDCNFDVFIQKLEILLKNLYPVGRHYMDSPLIGNDLKVKKNK